MIDKLRAAFSYDPETGDIVRLSTGLITGSRHSKGYLCVSYKSKSYLAHRVGWALHYGEWPSDQIDHVNHNKSDNRLVNIRCVSNSENHKNMPLQRNNKSGVSGVFWYQRYLKWTSYIKVSGKRKHLGYFEEFNDAVLARKDAEVLYGFHGNHGLVK